MILTSELGGRWGGEGTSLAIFFTFHALARQNNYKYKKVWKIGGQFGYRTPLVIVSTFRSAVLTGFSVLLFLLCNQLNLNPYL